MDRAGQRALGLATLVVVLVTARGHALGQSLSFSDRTQQVGLAVTHTPPIGIATSITLGGGAVADFDADGWQDVFVLGGGGDTDQLFMNRGNGTFVDRTSTWNAQHAHQGDATPGTTATFVDQSTSWGAARAHVGAGVAVGDTDGDGRLDLFVASHGTAAGLVPGAHLLYRNEGDHFTEHAGQAGVATTSPFQADGYGAAFGDYDLDGDLDLFVAGYLSNQAAPSFGNRLFANEGTGMFVDVTAQAELYLTLVQTFTPLFVDMDGDRYPELLLAADFNTSRYLVNEGDGSFRDETFFSGTGLDSDGMGQCVADFDGNGLLDWYVTSIEGPTGSGNMLYLNQGDHTFLEASAASGVQLGGWGWGAVAVDFDHNGWEDIAETNGWPNPPWTLEQSYLFMNQGNARFVEQALASGLEHFFEGRGLVHFDADNDGDQDLIFFAHHQPLTFFRNDLTGPDAHWLHVTLDSGGSPLVAPHGYGARIVAITALRTQQRFISGGGSYLSSSELSAHFGLGAETSVDVLRVEWPDGAVQELTDVAVDQRLTVTYGAEAPGG